MDQSQMISVEPFNAEYVEHDDTGPVRKACRVVGIEASDGRPFWVATEYAPGGIYRPILVAEVRRVAP